MTTRNTEELLRGSVWHTMCIVREHVISLQMFVYRRPKPVGRDFKETLFIVSKTLSQRWTNITGNIRISYEVETDYWVLTSEYLVEKDFDVVSGERLWWYDDFMEITL